jgi:membrane fusion protein (multidrug efflux system)
MTLRENAGSNGRAGRPALKIVLILVVCAALAGAYFAWRYFQDKESTDDAQIDGHIVPVAPRVGGTVTEVKVEDNQLIAAGTLLVQIDPKDYQVALAREEANLADARASLQAARSGVPIVTTTTASQVSGAAANEGRARAAVVTATWEVEAARARLVTAQARLREATANRVRLTQDLDRMKILIVKDEISRQQYDAAVALEEGARANEDAGRAAISEAEGAVAVAEGRLAQAKQVVEQAQAEVKSAATGPDQVAVTRARAAAAEAKVTLAGAAVEQARLNLQYTTIKSATGGVVSKKNIEPGQIVQPGQPLLAIVPLEDIWVTANFKETQLRAMRPGQRVSIVVDAYNRKFTGRVESIAAATGARFSLLPPENATGNYVKVVQRIPVKIVLEKGQDPEHLLRPGMSVVPTVFTR